jgi:hypothetical protein
LAEDTAAGKTDPRRLASLSADNDVRGIDFASSKRDAHRRHTIMTPAAAAAAAAASKSKL